MVSSLYWEEEEEEVHPDLNRVHLVQKQNETLFLPREFEETLADLLAIFLVVFFRRDIHPQMPKVDHLKFSSRENGIP